MRQEHAGERWWGACGRCSQSGYHSRQEVRLPVRRVGTQVFGKGGLATKKGAAASSKDAGRNSEKVAWEDRIK